MSSLKRKGVLSPCRATTVEVWVGLLALTVALGLSGCGSAGAPGGGSPGPSDDNEPPDDTLAREIEEADIVKFEDGYFYLANRWTGLRIIDARLIERPLPAGRVPMQGRAVELFVRDEHAFILSSADFFYCAGRPVGFDDDAASSLTTPDYQGSRITVVDVSDKQDPTLVAEFDLDGFVSATRRVGDVIYAAGSLPDDYTLPAEDDDAGTNGSVGTNGDLSTNGDDQGDNHPNDQFGFPRAFVASINIADPDHPYLVDREIFFGESFEINVTTQDAMFVAGVDPSLPETTLVTYVDISDPQGAVRLRDQFRVPGVIRNQYFMDEYAGVFRIVAQEFYGFYPTIWTVSLYTYDLRDPDDITRLARLPLVDNQGMRSVRFDGPRAYAATETVSDPLFVLDLADPTAPAIAGQLVILGISTHLVPLGDRLINIGVDNSYVRRPSLTLFDVSDPHEPQPMSRIVLGTRGGHTTSEANFDEKAVQILEDEQLILMPFAYYDQTALEWKDGVQMIDLLPTRLAERGEVTHRGLVRRSGVVDQRLWVLSDEAFKVADIDDRDDPRDLSALDIFSEQELLDSGLWGCVDSARWYDRPYGDLYGPGPYGYGMACGAGVPAAVMILSLGLAGFRCLGRRR
ncbi:MAG: beta-propeller domain-containing protein [Planctomycetota bacterium]